MLKNEYPYAVFVSYTFDDNVGVYPCRSEDEAKALLKKFFDGEVALDKENGNIAESALSVDGWSATIILDKEGFIRQASETPAA